METSHLEATVQVIVPARNEQDCIGRCLESLVSQQGIGFRITVVDDNSTDSTRAIAETFPGVHVISAPEPGPGITGKCNALITGAKIVGAKQGAKQAAAKWLLFTDADTVHYPGSLAAAVYEAETRGVDLLSYSPEQETASRSELALMPVVFADLVRVYPPERVNDPADPAVAANGQYILVRREVYEVLGGHQVVATKVLEDVELARLFKASGHRILFRHGAGLVRTRMYRSFRAMCEGWTKNLALLFRHPLWLALVRGLEFILILGLPIVAAVLLSQHNQGAGLLLLVSGLFFYLLFLMRVRRAHFAIRANLMALFGLPLFTTLLARSYLHANVRGAVTWKGRTYTQSAPTEAANSSTEKELS
jgi:glycosyltransferase involved in cell wall biosynthesis